LDAMIAFEHAEANCAHQGSVHKHLTTRNVRVLAPTGELSLELWRG
jgi:hypothetical protein